MLSISKLTLMALGILIVLLTPGPTNTLLAAAGLKQGIKRSLPLIAAELAGYLAAISVWGCFLISAAHAIPGLGAILRVICGLYIAYLAIKMWRTTTVHSTSKNSAIDLRTMFVATLFNPKGLLFAGSLFPASAFINLRDYAASITVFSCLTIPIAFGWISFGATLGQGGHAWVNPVKLQRGASIVLSAFSISMVWAAFHA